MQKRVLGRGLSALMPEKSSERGIKAVNVKIAQIAPNKFQPRKLASPEKMQELIASIKEKGVIQPVLVRPKGDGYELIAGERRLQAAKKLGFSQLPAIIKDAEDNEALQLALIENIQREELNPLEEAQAYQRLIAEFGFTQDKIAQMVGRNPSSVSNILRLLKLPKEIREALHKGMISMGHARTILALKSLAEQDRLFKRTVGQQLSVRELESLVAKTKGLSLRKKKTQLRDPHLIDLEDRLQKALATKVRIMSGRKRGKITVEYYSLRDLERIVNILLQR